MYISLSNFTNASWGGRWRELRDKFKDKFKNPDLTTSNKLGGQETKR